MIPIRCFTCGAVISKHWDEYKGRISAGEDQKTVLDDLGVKRYCCRRMLLTHKELVDIFAPYQ
jgi:DNA-directed RNA polymerase subunit N